MDVLLKDPIFWAAISAVGTIAAALGASLGIWVARSQLRELARTAGSDAVLALYNIFDDEKNRQRRRRIWKEISVKESKELTDDEWDVIERTATAMDVVGTMLKHDLVRRELIFERYTEVIVPLWRHMKIHIDHRRAAKGGHGWENFEWMFRECDNWSRVVRGTDEYHRF
jgi:hypothetical protein